ncbi:MAG: NAD(P)/FAD-dependent oxidoreductase [Ilumatobacteraceae bacterium]
MIVGAGISGLALGAQLGRLGVRYVILEKNEEIGGTWWENRYPGCGVDTPNHAYSFSFGERFEWTRYFSKRDEIERYLCEMADSTGVREHTRFCCEVDGAEWDETTRRWRVRFTDEAGRPAELDADVLVSAVGVLNMASIPDFAGRDRFEGLAFHSSRWPDDLDLTDQRVAVVGTGATAMQLVPTAAQAASITVYQRSAQWARDIPGYRDEITDNARWLLANVPFYADWFRLTMFWRYGDGLLPYLRKDPEWAFPERSVNRINDRHRQEMADFIERELDGRPDLLEKCMPTYPPYGKRILLDNGWFATLRQPHVELVTDPIEEFTTTGIVVDGVERPADIVVFATGFQTMQFAARLDIRGRGGRSLRDEWLPDDASAHLGLTVPGFPNFFCLVGPTTGLGHGGSLIFVIECQARYICSALSHLTRTGATAMEVRQEVHDEYRNRADAEHEQLIWTHPGMTNWYRNSAGRVVALMPWRLVDYWNMTHDFDPSEYEVTGAVQPAT